MLNVALVHHFRVRRPRDPFDIELTDSELAAEVELLAALMVAASTSDRPLSGEEIDRLLVAD
jgi:hypothetical protein